MGKKIPKEYNAMEVEAKWQQEWDESIYYYQWTSDKPNYVIDTPPPYPTGDFHVGNAFNWCYIDYIARYKRMRGYNVMFPQGWDCHGLPTEVKVEEIHGITKNQVPRAEFRRLCEELTSENIEKMRDTMNRLGFSIDWSNEYVTMMPAYYRRTQISFVRMHNEGMIYREKHPVNWCPRCETAIAFAEVEYTTRDTLLTTFVFDKVNIATTRPELLPACVAVAVHPDDERYQNLVGETLKVPIFGQEVPIFTDPYVDPEFGTGIVMICTFGDKQDVRWWKEHNLPLREALDRQGRMTQIADKYEGMSSEECKQAILKDMQDQGLIVDQTTLEQNVGTCWRCETPIEILSERQWFVRVDPEQVLETAKKVEWYPGHMFIRLKNWTESMEWDWCISRQRIFATPIPVWSCTQCGKVMVAEENWLPLDPMVDQPRKPCSCGSTEFHGEEDVLDTWMDSSISALVAAGWIDRDDIPYPTQLRPQGHDIIRTWAFYTILRSKALMNTYPWDTILINGMVLGGDGYKMSKSRGNIVPPEEVIDKHGSDAFRQWAAIGGSPGSDVMFTWKDVTAASRFLQKMWNILRFTLMHIEGEIEPPLELRTTDQWLLIKLNHLMDAVTAQMDEFNFDEAIKSIRGFTWDILADNYIELAKSRLYGDDEEGKASARYALYTTVNTMSRMLAPIIPFFAEEMYSHLTSEDESVHTQPWPEPDSSKINIEAGEQGELIKDVASTIRRYKSEHGMALNAPMGEIEIYTNSSDLDLGDAAGAVNTEFKVISGAPAFEMKASKIDPNMSVLGPKYTSRAGEIAGVIKTLNPAEAAAQLSSHVEITIETDSGPVNIDTSCVKITRETTSHGRSVDVLEVEGIVIVIPKK